MRLRSIASHLRPYVMVQRRRTTINHAFAAAVAPSDIYDEEVVGAALRLLGQDPERDLECAYCGALAETWDHVTATVRNREFSGHGHRIGNLLPCCKSCNSRKGNKAWDRHLASLGLEQEEYVKRRSSITSYIATYSVLDSVPSDSSDLQRLQDIRHQVLALLDEGDQIAARIRAAHSEPSP